MPRVNIQDIRRRELIEATIRAVHRHSFAELTVKQIAEQAGISAGAIHHYFGSKEGLLEATMRWLLSTLRVCVLRRTDQAVTPREKLLGYVEANFDDALFTPEIIAAWVQFWAYAPHVERLARLQRINAGRVRANILHAIKQLVRHEHAEAATFAIQAYMDGVWLQNSQVATPLPPGEARRLVRDMVQAVITFYTTSTPATWPADAKFTQFVRRQHLASTP
jgi:TetR/AcrR family transcriptional repressor of bet genes